MAVADFNRFGGDILARDNYLPQRHDSAKVAAVRREDWIAFTRGLLDREKMIDTRPARR